MANTKVRVRVRYGAPSNQQIANGWKQCEDNGGNLLNYRYRFKGGNQPEDDGSFEFDCAPGGGQPKLILVKLIAANSYRIKQINFDYIGSPTNQDLSAVGSGKRFRTIVDANQHQQSGAYIVVVTHSSGGVDTDLYCHPRWRNN